MLLLIVLLPLLLGTAATFWLGSRSRLLTALAAGAVTATSLGLLLSQVLIYGCLLAGVAIETTMGFDRLADPTAVRTDLTAMLRRALGG